MAATGLTEAEAQRRLAARGPVLPPASSRSTASIVRANVFTVFNAILVGMGVLTLAFGAWQDALFLAIVVANTGIGIAQELRAKRKLDELAALVAPHATVVRDGRAREVAVEDVVEGDLLRIEAGDQVVADGTLDEAAGLRLDESILTGESRPVARGPGEEVRSGSFAVEGAGAFVVTAVGDDSYAQRIAGEAREFRHPRSPLERALNRLLLVLVAVMVPLGTIFVYSLWQRDVPIREAVTTAVAGIVTLVPEGLVLLLSLTFAAAALQLARRGALAQQLNATESLAAVDVLCLDKTGTLTHPGLRVVAIEPAVDRRAARPFRSQLSCAERDAARDRGRGPGRGGDGRGLRAVLVRSSLQRAHDRGRALAARGAGALRPGRARRPRRGRAGRGPARARVRQRPRRPGARRPRRGAARRRALDRRVLPPRGRRAACDLRRQPPHRRGDRA